MLSTGCVQDSMEVLLCVNGWLDQDTDYYTVWSSLQHSTHQLALPHATPHSQPQKQQPQSEPAKPSGEQQTAHMAPTKADGSAHVVGLAPSLELYALKWESPHLHAFGVFLQSMTVKALAKGRHSNTHTASPRHKRSHPHESHRYAHALSSEAVRVFVGGQRESVRAVQPWLHGD